MAVDRLDLLTGSYIPIFNHMLKDLGTRECPVIAKLMLSPKKAGKTQRGGSEWKYPVKSRRKTDVTVYDDPYEVFEFSGTQTAHVIKTSPIFLEHNISVSEMEINWNAGEAEFVDYRELKTSALMDGWEEQHAKACWGHATNWTGLNDVTDFFTDDSTFMNLAPADVAGAGFHPTDAARSLWDAQYDTATTDLSDHAIENMINVKIAEGYPRFKPSLMASNPTTFQAYKSLHNGQVWISDKDLLDVGFDDQVSVAGVPWVASPYAKGSGAGTADNCIYFFPPKGTFYWQWLAGYSPSVKRYDMRPKQATFVFQMLPAGQIVWRDREHAALMSTIDPTVI